MLKLADLPTIYTHTGPGTPRKDIHDGVKQYLLEMLEATNDDHALTKRYNWLTQVVGPSTVVLIDLAMCSIEVAASVNVGAMNRNPIHRSTYDVSNRMSQGVLDADILYEAIRTFQKDVLTLLERGKFGTSHVYGTTADGSMSTVCMRCDVQAWATCFNVPRGNPIAFSVLRPYLCLPWLSDGLLRDIELDVAPGEEVETPSITPIGADPLVSMKPRKTYRQDKHDLASYRWWIHELRNQKESGVLGMLAQIPDNDNEAICDWQCLFSWWAVNGWLNAKYVHDRKMWSVGISELLMINGVSLEQEQDQMDVTTFGGPTAHVPGLIRTTLKVEFPMDHFHLYVPLPWAVEVTRSAETAEYRLSAPAGWWGVYTKEDGSLAADGPTGADPGTLRKRNNSRKQVQAR